MAARLVARAPWVTALVAAFLLATAAWTAAAARSAAPVPGAVPQAEKPKALVVPDVRHQAYVFAKGALEQSGFAWRVDGKVQGYAANLVVGQSPVAGARVVADGKPLVLLVLARNPAYTQEGKPENASPYAGRPARLVAAVAQRQAAAAPAAATAPVAKPAAKPAAAATPAAKPAVKPVAKPAARPAEFVAPGAPREPLTEIPLTQRAKELAAWLERHPSPTTANVNHWLYQHSWIVTGAQFGWWRGAEALKILAEVDRRAQTLWGIGGRSEQVARRALAEVQARAQ